MFEDITLIDLKILSLYIRDYSSTYSIREITQKLKINYPNAFKRVKGMIKKKLLLMKKSGQANNISFNIMDTTAVQMLSYVEEMENKKIGDYEDIIHQMILIDPFACMGISDGLFVITSKKKELMRVNSIANVFTPEEFQESLFSVDNNPVKSIIRNKQIIYNPYPFYNIAYKWERIKHAE